MAAARREIRRVRAWNDAVGRYWNEIADAVARFFEERWRDLPEDVRRARVAEILKPYEARLRAGRRPRNEIVDPVPLRP